MNLDVRDILGRSPGGNSLLKQLVHLGDTARLGLGQIEPKERGDGNREAGKEEGGSHVANVEERGSGKPAPL